MLALCFASALVPAALDSSILLSPLTMDSIAGVDNVSVQLRSTFTDDGSGTRFLQAEATAELTLHSRFGLVLKVPGVWVPSDEGNTFAAPSSGIGGFARFEAAGFAFVGHGLVFLPTASTGASEQVALVTTSASRLTDLAAHLRDVATVRVALRAQYTRGVFFALSDLGLDQLVPTRDEIAGDTWLRYNQAIGLRAGDFKIAVEWVNVIGLREPEEGNPWRISGALSAAWRLDDVLPTGPLVLAVGLQSGLDTISRGEAWTLATAVTAEL